MLTAKGAATRQRIIEAAAAEIRLHGVDLTRLDDVGARAGTGKSQMFHYFPRGKDELLVAVAEFEARRVLDDQQPHLDDLTTWESWRRWEKAVVARYERQGRRCPLGVLLTELGRTSPQAQQVTATLLGQWQEHLTEGVRALQRREMVSATVDPQRTAAAIVAGIQGGAVLLMTTGSSVPLRASLATSMDYLRCAGG